MPDKSYLKVGSAKDLQGKDRAMYRAFEILPGFLSWTTILGVIFFSWQKPVWVAVFIIVFDVYWLVKTVYLSFHLNVNWRKMRRNLKTDWRERLSHLKWEHVWQMVIFPVYKESAEVISGSLDALLKSGWPKERFIVVMTFEERGSRETEETRRRIKEKYAPKFKYFLDILHPAGVPGELPGKGSNIAWAAKEVKEKIIDARGIKHEDIIVSSFDVDTRVYPQYFLCLAYNFLTAEKPYRSSFQPVPIYNNNIWDAPAVSRVVATSGTFWQMMQQERPERLATFSSHSMGFKQLCEMGYWQKNIVSEDSRIFWNAILRFDGNYRVIPLAYPVSLDANLGPNFWQTVKNVYKQQRRWCWGVENIPYLLFGFMKNKAVPLKKRLRFIFTQLEGFWSLSTNPILIFLLGWLPLLIGGQDFNSTLLSYNLPRITRFLMTLAMFGLVGSAIISTTLLPSRPPDHFRFKNLSMVLQWLLVPFTIVFFGAIPGLDAQTRLMLGKYMGFWVTPKWRHRSSV